MSGTRWVAVICLLSFVSGTAFTKQYSVSETQISSLLQETRILRLRLSKTQQHISEISSNLESLRTQISDLQTVLRQQKDISVNLRQSLERQLARSMERLRLLEESKALLKKSRQGIEDSLKQHRRALWKARIVWLLIGGVVGWGLSHA